MKLPFELGVKLIFRLIIPGFFLSLGFLPAMSSILELGGWKSRFEYVYILLIIFSGWLIIISDMWIYMLYEGRRWWPGSVRKFFVRLEKRRLKGILARAEVIDSKNFKRKQERLKRLDRKIKLRDGLDDGDNKFIKTRERIAHYLTAGRQGAAEAYFDLRKFPINAEGEYDTPFPTRIGNLIAAYEEYPGRIYSLDSVFFWNRLILRVDKDTREEIDNRQAVADSTIYTSCALLLAGALWIVYALLFTLAPLLHKYWYQIYSVLPLLQRNLIEQIPNVVVAYSLLVIFILTGFIVYRLSLPLHAQFGDVFKAFFDVHQDKIDVSDVFSDLYQLTYNHAENAANLDPNLGSHDQRTIVWRYLQFYRYRCPKCGKLMLPGEAATHTCRLNE